MLEDDDSVDVIIVTVDGVEESHTCEWLRSQIEQKPFCSILKVRDACRLTCAKFAPVP